MHDEDRNSDRLQIFGEIGLGKSLDALILRLGAAHHTLTPPIVDGALQRRHTRAAVESVDRAGGEVA